MSLKDLILDTGLNDKYKGEQIFVVPYIYCNSIPDYFSIPTKKDIDYFFNHILNHGIYVERYKAEGNATLQQIIPYVILTNNQNITLISKRIGGEKRLLNQLSLGFGGHINQKDINNDKQTIINNAIMRELSEELTLNTDKLKQKPELIGFVRNIKSNLPDHLGIVYKLNIKNRKPQIKEKDKLEGVWMDSSKILHNLMQFEPWAQFIIAKNTFKNYTE